MPIWSIMVRVMLLAAVVAPAWGAPRFSELFPRSTNAQGTEAAKQASSAALVPEETEEEKLIDAVTIRQVKFANEWNPDPTAPPQLCYQFRKALRMRCQWISEPIELSDPELFKCPLLYMSSHNSFNFTKAEREGLKRYLLQGGLLISDDCSGGGGGWLPSFAMELEKMFPGNPLVDISPDDKRFKGVFNICYTFRGTPKIVSDFDNVALMLDNRMAVFVGKDDYGCMWEVSSPPTAAAPLGVSNHGFGPSEMATAFEFAFN
ncbi:MAG: DUF4159 domain-containing protein, partial [Lentisphaerae bacterium]|nr:DUF4159 domain-containing protein [Lentisphaerota bacterium]